MKLRSAFLLLATLFSSFIQAQDLTIHVNKKGKVGFVDKNGKEVIKCKYESAYPFERGYAIVSESEKFGIIDAKGKEVLPIKYSSILPWTESLYIIKDGKTMGLASHSGNIVVKPKYTSISKPNSYGKALITVGGKQGATNGKPCIVNGRYGIINTRGIIVIEPKYFELYEFTEPGENSVVLGDGYAPYVTEHPLSDTLKTDCAYLAFNVRQGAMGCGVLDARGTIILKAGQYDMVMQPHNGMIRYYDYKKKETHCGYYNLKTKKNIEVTSFGGKFEDLDFWTHGDFNKTIAPVSDDDTWNFVNKNGRVVRRNLKKIEFDKNTALWAAQQKSKEWVVFDEENEDVEALSGFEDIEFPTETGDAEIFIVKKNDVYGGITRNGKTVIPFEYQDAMGNTNDVIPLKKDEKWGALSPSGQVIIPFEYDGVIPPSERGTKDLWVKKDDNLYYHYNSGTQVLSSTGYEGVINFIKGVAQVRPKGMKLADTEVNRAQIFLPNTSHERIDTVDVSSYKKSFGYLLRNDDQMLIDLPVSSLYKDMVMKKLEGLNFRTLTESEKKNILLEVTKENRSYDLGEIIKENEWNY